MFDKIVKRKSKIKIPLTKRKNYFFCVYCEGRLYMGIGPGFGVDNNPAVMAFGLIQ